MRGKGGGAPGWGAMVVMVAALEKEEKEGKNSEGLNCDCGNRDGGTRRLGCDWSAVCAI